MKIYCILREKIWNLNFNKLWKPRSIFFADSEHYFPSHLLKLHFRALRIVLLKEKIGKKWKWKNFSQTSSKFFENVFRTALNMSGEAFWADFFLQNFNFPAILRTVFPHCCQKKQSSCPEKELCKTKFEKRSKMKQFFSDFDQNVSAG